MSAGSRIAPAIEAKLREKHAANRASQERIAQIARLVTCAAAFGAVAALVVFGAG